MRHHSAPKSWFIISHAFCLKHFGSKTHFLCSREGSYMTWGLHAGRQTSPVHCPEYKGSHPFGHTAAGYLRARDIVLPKLPREIILSISFSKFTSFTRMNTVLASQFLSELFQPRRHGFPYNHGLWIIHCNLHPSLLQVNKGELCISRYQQQLPLGQ